MGEVGVRTDPHAAPRLVVVMVLAFHQFQSLLGILVVQLHGLVDGDVHRVAESVVYLDESYDAVVDECNELGSDAFTHQRLFLDFQRADALGLDKQLVCQRRGSQNTPRSPVVVELLLEQRAAFADDLFKLAVGLFFLRCQLFDFLFFI